LLALGLHGAVGCPLAAAAGTGLTGSYHDNRTFSGAAVTRVDASIDFTWPAAPGPAGIGADSFSVRWEGQVEALVSEVHTFHVFANDGALLWVDDQLIVGRTTTSPTGGEMAGSIRLEAGRRYNLRLEFIEDTGEAAIRLAWSSATTPRQIVPAARLYPQSETPERGTIMLERWEGLPSPGLPALLALPGFPLRPSGRESLISFECLAPNTGDNYGQRVSGYLVPAVTGSYTLAVAAADTAELWLSPDADPARKARIVQVTTATAVRQFTRTSDPITLQQGQKYYIELLHQAGTGPDHFSVAWLKPGATAFEVIAADSLMPTGLDRTPPGQGNYLATLATGHPRLFITPQKVEWLKQQLAANTDAKLVGWYNALKASADTIRTQTVNLYVPDDRGTILGVSRSVYDRTYKLALAYLITGDAGYAERLYQELEKAANPAGSRAPGDFPDWHPAHFLDVAEMSHAFAVGLDWLYHYWTPARRAVLRQAIATRGLTPGLQEYTRNVGWTRPDNNNWNLVCTGGLTLGALAIAGEDATDTSLVEQILHHSVTKVAPVMARYTTDNGGWYEGPGYWDFATEYNCRMLAALESALGSDFRLSATRGLSLTGYFPPYLVGPTRLSFNFADAGSGNVAGSQLLWLARRFNKPEYAWYQRANGGSEVLNLFWYDTRGNDPVTDGFPLDRWFRGATGATSFAGQDIVTLRSQWLDSRATFIAAKAGEVGASHGNLDAGTFVLDALGHRWAMELGGDDYALPGYFSEPQRWTYYRMRAEGQNTLVINPGSGADQVLRTRPPVVHFATEPNPERGATIMDLTSAYAGATSVQRGFALFNRRRHVLIQDEIQYPATARVWWFMHYGTDKTAIVESGGSSVMLSKGTDRLWLKILSGGGTFQIMDATPLPSSPNPAGQNANSTVKKLAIHLPAVTQATLAVYAVPLLPGENPPAILPAVTPLAGWPMTGSVPAFAWSAGATPGPQAWSNAAHWSPAVNLTDQRGAALDLFSGRILPAGELALNNDLGAGLTVNTLTLGGTSSGVARVVVAGRPLALAAQGGVAPLVALRASAGAGLSYDVTIPLILAATTTVEVSGSAAFRLAGELSGPGGLTVAGSAPLLLCGANTHTGPITIAAGTLQVGDNGPTGSLGPGPVANHGTLRFQRTGTLLVSNAIAGPGNLTVAGPPGEGTIVLSGQNTFTGGVTVSSGALRITRSNALGGGVKTLTLTAGTAGNPQLRLDGSGGDIVVPAAITFATSNTNGAVFNEAGRNTLEGNFILSAGGGNTKIVVEAGTLTLNGSLAPNTTSRNLDLGGAGHGVVNGSIADGAGANTLGFIKSGGGTWTLAGANTWTGNTTVSGGTLLVQGSLAPGGPVTVANGATLGGSGAIARAVTIQSGGRLAPGTSLGTLQIAGPLTLAAGSTTAMELDALTLGCDRVTGPARISYGGTLALTRTAGTFSSGQSFTLFSATVATGSFSAITPAAPGPGLAWDFNPFAGVLRVVEAASPASDSRIANLSVLTTISAADPIVIVGTVIGGAEAVGGKPLLVRAAGPSLAPHGVANWLADPVMELFAGSAALAANDDWGADEAVLSAAFARLGAFAFLARDSRDAAVHRAALGPGNYSVQVTGGSGSTGTVLVELYDGTAAADGTATTPRLLNVSVRKQVEPGGLLTTGFVIAGSRMKQVLVRAVGPTLGGVPFNVPGTMADPKIELYHGATLFAGNDNWGGGADLAAVFSRTGAFALPATSRDAALLVALPPGVYTAQITGAGGGGGVVIVEIYEVP
jgi:autotransporter-associated beta strand protein